MQFKIWSLLVVVICLSQVHGLRTPDALRRSEREVAGHQSYPSHSPQSHAMPSNPGHSAPQPPSGSYIPPPPVYNRNSKGPDGAPFHPMMPANNRPSASANQPATGSYDPTIPAGPSKYPDPVGYHSKSSSSDNEIPPPYSGPSHPSEPYPSEPNPSESSQPHLNRRKPALHVEGDPPQYKPPRRVSPDEEFPNLLPEINTSDSSPTGRSIGGGAMPTGRTLAQIGQFKAGAMGLISSVVGLNGFGVRNDQASATITATNPDVYTTSGSHMLTMLCMTTVCTPSGQVDLVNTMEFSQCVSSCLSNPKIPLALYVYKNYGNLQENMKIKSEQNAKLPGLLTTNTVVEGIDTLRQPNYGLGNDQISELTNFRSTLLAKTLK